MQHAAKLLRRIAVRRWRRAQPRVSNMTALLLLAIGSVDSSTLSGADLATLSETELHHLSRRVTAELHRRQAAPNSTVPNSSQWYVHKFTRATADPKAAADFMIQHVGAQQGMLSKGVATCRHIR